MQTLALRPGDPLPLIPGNEWRPTPPAVADNDLAGRVFQHIDPISAEVIESVQIQVRPLHRTLLVESTRDQITLGAPDDVEWSVISLALMQRVQRLLTWPTLINDLGSVLRILLSDELAVMDAPPRGWEQAEIRDAMMRLLNTRDTNHRKLMLSDGTTPVYVDREQSAALVERWSSSPYRLIKRAKEGARPLLQNYLGIQYDSAVPPEVQTGQRGASVTIDIGSLTGPAPHNGTSFVVVGHPGRGAPTIVYDVHVLPTSVEEVLPTTTLNLAARSPSPFAAFMAYVREQAPSTWNNYNIGWRATAAYGQPGTSVSDAVRSFNADPRFPLVRSLGTKAPAATYTSGTLVFELADFGDDPFLQALIGTADTVSTQRSDRDSFGMPNPAAANGVLVPGWAPRRLSAAGFVDQALPPVSESVEQERTNEERAERTSLYREAANIFGTVPIQTIADRLPGSRTELMKAVATDERTKSTATLVSQVNLLRKSLSRTFLDLFAENYLLADALRQEIGQRGRPYIVPLLQRAAFLLGHQANKTSATLSNAQMIVDELQSRVIRLSYMASLYRGVPVVNDRLTFEDVVIGRMKRENARIDQSDVEFIETFALPRLGPLLDDQEDHALFKAGYKAPVATVAPVPPVARGGGGGGRGPPRGFFFPAGMAGGAAPAPAAGGGAPGAGTVFDAGWAFQRAGNERLFDAITAYNLDKEGSRFLKFTGLSAVPTMRNVLAVVPGSRLPPRTEDYVRLKQWMPLELIPASSLLPAILGYAPPVALPAVDPYAGWAPELRTRPDLQQFIKSPELSTPVMRAGASQMLMQTGLARLPIQFNPASKITTPELATYVANGWRVLEDTPAGSLIAAVLMRQMQQQQQQSVQPAASTVPKPAPVVVVQPPPPVVTVPAIDRRALLTNAFGQNISLMFGNDQVDAVDATALQALLPLEAASPAGLGILDAINYIQDKARREQDLIEQARLKEQRELAVATAAATQTRQRLGFPAALDAAIAAAPKETREQFARLTPLDSLSLIRLGRTLAALLPAKP